VGRDDGGDDAAGRDPGSIIAAQAGGGVRTVPLFVGSYLAVWALVSVVVYTLYRPHEAVAAAVVVIAAGIYELTPLKRYFLAHCRRVPSGADNAASYPAPDGAAMIPLLTPRAACSQDSM
jgi:hypothetical protein